MLLRSKVLALISIGSIALLAACSSDDRTPVSKLDWTACSDSVEDSALECANLAVPMDYSQPSDVMIDIALVRVPATGADKLGSLLFNPGGPGGSGVDLIKEFAQGNDAIPSSILAAYDIVGFDPRGIGDSTQVDCTDEGVGDVAQYPVTPEDLAQLIEDAMQSAAACSLKYGDYLQHLGSLNVVRDMDEIRVALGDEKLNFVGYSYGTRLAALYLQEFPQNSGRFILDASVRPVSTVRALLEDQMPKLEENLLVVLSECVNTDPNCDANDLLDKLAARVDTLATDPSAAAEFELVFEFVSIAVDELELGLLAAPALLDYIDTFDIGALTLFVQGLVDLGIINGESEGDTDEDNETTEIAVICADDATRPDIASLTAVLDDFNSTSDLFAEAQVSTLGRCAGWPEALEPLAPIVTNTAPMSLVIGGSNDALTPIQWSEEMASQIGGAYITSNHPGHTVVFNGLSQCIDDIAEDFLINGNSPTTTQCF